MTQKKYSYTGALIKRINEELSSNIPKEQKKDTEFVIRLSIVTTLLSLRKLATLPPETIDSILFNLFQESIANYEDLHEELDNWNNGLNKPSIPIS